MAIPNGDGVDGTTIHAKAKSVVVLGYQDDGHGARTQALADMSHGKKFLYLPLDLFCLLGVGAVRSAVWKRCAGNKVDAVLDSA